MDNRFIEAKKKAKHDMEDMLMNRLKCNFGREELYGDTTKILIKIAEEIFDKIFDGAYDTGYVNGMTDNTI